MKKNAEAAVRCSNCKFGVIDRVELACSHWTCTGVVARLGRSGKWGYVCGMEWAAQCEHYTKDPLGRKEMVHKVVHTSLLVPTERELQRMADKVERATGIRPNEVRTATGKRKLKPPVAGLSPARLSKSSKLIREHLVKHHDDGDGDSLFVRFNQILQHLEEITREWKLWQKRGL